MGRALAILLLVAVLGNMHGAAAQSAPDAAKAENGDGTAPASPAFDAAALEERVAAVSRPSSSVVDAAVEGRGRAANRIIGKFLADGNAVPRQRVARGIALIRQARRDGRVSRTGSGAMFDRVSTALDKAVNSPLVFGVAIDSDFVPPPNVSAFDLGPPDGRVAPGFEAVDADNPMLHGEVRAFEKTIAEGALVADGLVGTKGFQMVLPNGSYRVVLITGKPPGRTWPTAPFGHTIRANYETYYLGNTRPGNVLGRAWITPPVLDDPLLRRAYRQDPARDILREDPARNPGGYGIGIAFRTEVLEGYLKVDFEALEETRLTHISAILVEPAEQTAVWITERKLAQNTFAHRIAALVADVETVSNHRAAAVVAYAVGHGPSRAEEIFKTGLKLFPKAAADIARAVAGLSAVNSEQVTKWVAEVTTLPSETKKAVLAGMPAVQQARGEAE